MRHISTLWQYEELEPPDRWKVVTPSPSNPELLPTSSGGAVNH